MSIFYEDVHPWVVEIGKLQHLMKLAPDLYDAAVAEATRIQQSIGIPMVVESLKPVHFGWSSYSLPVGTTSRTLRSNTAMFAMGLFSTDTTFETMKWWKGMSYVADWPAILVSATLEKEMMMTPSIIIKGGESFRFTVVKVGAGATVSAFLLGYAVLPETSMETPIMQ